MYCLQHFRKKSLMFMNMSAALKGVSKIVSILLNALLSGDFEINL